MGIGGWSKWTARPPAGCGSGFSLTVYALEVTTGKSYSQPYSSGSHGGVILPTSAPLVLTLEAPGTYVFYANLIHAAGGLPLRRHQVSSRPRL